MVLIWGKSDEDRGAGVCCDVVSGQWSVVSVIKYKQSRTN